MKIEIDITIRKLTLVFIVIAFLSTAIVNARLDIDTDSVDYTGGIDFIISSDGNISIQATYDLNVTSDVNVSGDLISNNLILSKSSSNGIKIDIATPTFGWHDLLGEIRTRGVGVSDPNDATYIGNIKGYQFDVNDQCWVNFHIPHDYVDGTDIYLHFHWSHNSAIVTGGTVTWGANATYAKGHNQSAFSSNRANITVIGGASITQYQHMITEVKLSASTPDATQIDTDDLEPDGVIMLRAYLNANGISSDGAVPDPFLHFIDIHYQSTNIGTKDKVPDFYT